MNNGSFVSKIVEKEGGNVRFLTAEENGRDAWFMVKLDPHMYHLYKSALKTGNMDIADYGEILESGWGEPDAQTKRFLLEKYPLTVRP